MGIVKATTAVSLVTFACMLCACTKKEPAPPPPPKPVHAKRARPKPRPKPVEHKPGTTETYGVLPDSLAGTWLLAQHTKTHTGYLNSIQLYRITRTAGRWEVTQLHADEPKAVKTLLRRANSAGVALELDAQAVRAARPMMEQGTVVLSSREGTFMLTDARHFRAESAHKYPEAKFSIEFLSFEGKGVVAGGTSYFVTADAGDKLSGKFEIGSLIHPRGTILVPIAVDGTFSMYRLGGGEPGSATPKP